MEAILAQLLELNNRQRQFLVHFFGFAHVHRAGNVDKFKAVFHFPNPDFITQNDHFLFLNAPAVLMPYVRAHLSACTVMAGYPPLNLPLFNMASFAEKLKENTVFEI